MSADHVTDLPARHTGAAAEKQGGGDTSTRLTLLAVLTVGVVAVFLVQGLGGTWQFVLPRRALVIATMAVVATAIAASTVLFHTVTTNHILTPSVMGFDSLYVLVQTTAVVGLGVMWTTDLGRLPRFGLETALMLACSLPLMAWLFLGHRRSIELVVLLGLVTGGLFRSGSSFLQRLMDPAEFLVLQDRFFADFTSTEPRLLAGCAVLTAVVTLCVWRRRVLLDVLALGPDVSTSLGVDHRRVTMLVLVAVTLLVASSTALVGPTLFFGLLVAHLGYRIVGSHRHALTIPATALAGTAVLVLGQLLFEEVLGFAGRMSMVVELVGGLTFVLMYLRRVQR